MIVSITAFLSYIHLTLEAGIERKAKMAMIAHKNKVITVAIVDDDVNIRDGLWWLLNNVKGMQCIGAYASWPEAMTAFTAQAPDVLLLDVSLQNASGLDSIKPMRAKFPAMKIVMHSNYDNEEKIMLARTRGASGYVLKNASAPALHAAILSVYGGKEVWPVGYQQHEPSVSSETRSTSIFSLFQKAKSFFSPS